MARLFVGIPVSEEIKAGIKLAYSQLSTAGADLNLVSLDNLHFTLKFLGEVEESLIPEIKQKLAEIKLKPFTLSVEKVGYFPGGERVNVVWAGTESKEMLQLIRELNQKLDYVHKEKQETEVPHLTLARVKSGKNKEQLLKILDQLKNGTFGRMEISRFILYESQLTPKKPVYTALEEFRLK